MSQLFALVWLKWRLMRNSMRSWRAAAGRAASVLMMAVGLLLSVGVGALLGFAAYRATVEERSGGGESAYFLLLFFFVMVFMLWALVPLGMGGGSRFDAGLLLLYPVSLRKLFAVDFVSELASLSTVFAAPTVFGLAVGAGLGAGRLTRAALAGLAAFACGLALAKMLSTAVGSLMRRRRTRGETVLALLGGGVGLAGALMGQLAPYMARHAESLRGVRWTPPGAAAVALSEGLGEGGAGAYAAAVLTLSAYAAGFVLITYRIARRTALGMGGGSRRARGRKTTAAAAGGEGYAGWQLPLMSAEMSALVEKELRYALRNAQLKVIGMMAVGLTIVLRLAPFGGGPRGGRGAGWERFSPYAEGAGTVFGVLYVFMLVSPLSTNLFGYDGAGLRALVLAPVERWKILVGKNVAVTLVTALLAAASVAAGGLVFGDLTARTSLFAALAFTSYAALFALAGNWLSLHFPKRVEFGKRMNRSGVAGLMLVPVFVALAAVPFVAVGAAHFARSHAVKYVILALVAAASLGLYLLLIMRQGRSLARRELDIMEAVTGKTGDEGGQILG